MSDDERAADALAALQAINTDQIEYKADLPPAVLSIENRDVTTLFSVDNLDSGGDITEPGAFHKSITERGERIPHLYMHDLHAPAIARIRGFTQLKRAELPGDVQAAYPEATGGWACTSRYLKTGRAAEIFEGIQEGIGYQASFGFQTVKAVRATMPDGRTARRIKELRLLEVSTTLPGHAMNPATRTMRLAKAAELIDEMKAGWRHGKHDDIEKLTQIYETVAYLLGIEIAPREAEPSVYVDDVQTLTSESDALLTRFSALSEVVT